MKEKVAYQERRRNLLYTTQRLLALTRYFVLIVLLPIPVGAQDDSEDFQLIHKGYGLSLHKEMYMMPITYSNKYNGNRTEVIFQLSAKHQIFKTPLYFGYTQISFWQAYDRNNSAPFRETNYNPELFYRSRRFPFYGGRFGADIGFEHESNGQKPPISRSWNLLYTCPYYYQSNFLLYIKFRYRLPEEKKEFEGSALGDDNPDITDFLGYNDFHLFYRFLVHHLLHLTVRGNVKTGKGSVALNYSMPIPTGKVSYLNIRIFRGYGESLVDYNRSLTRIGCGIMFAR
jgi:phospholipase A1